MFLLHSDSSVGKTCATRRPGTNDVSPVPSDGDNEDRAHGRSADLVNLRRTGVIWVKETKKQTKKTTPNRLCVSSLISFFLEISLVTQFNPSSLKSKKGEKIYPVLYD